MSPTPSELNVARDLLARYRNDEALHVTSLSLAVVVDEDGHRFALVEIVGGREHDSLFGFVYRLEVGDLARLAQAALIAEATPDGHAISAQVFTPFPEMN